MKIKKPVNFSLGTILVLFGLFFFIFASSWKGIFPFLIGGSLCYIGIKPGKTATLIFGHITVVVGCMLLTWGIYLLPYSEPIIEHIFFRPLFWGLISIFGGICAIYHGFCKCVRNSC